MGNAAKDLGYYARMAGDARAACRIGDAVAATLDAAVQQGGPRSMVPELVSLLQETAE